MRPGLAAIVVGEMLGGRSLLPRGGGRDRDRRSPEVVAEMLAAAELKRRRRAQR